MSKKSKKLRSVKELNQEERLQDFIEIFDRDPELTVAVMQTIERIMESRKNKGSNKTGDFK